MLTATDQRLDERRKHLEALRRAIPITRMVDYGVPLGDAFGVHASTDKQGASSWDETCERLALRHRSVAHEAESAGHRLTASRAWRTSAALLTCAHLAYNEDVPRKRALYDLAHAAMRSHANLSDDLQALEFAAAQGTLHAWVVRPTHVPPRAAVIVIGGLSGWGAAYLNMGRALAARGMIAVLGEGPGQGLTRLRGRLYLDGDSVGCLSRFVDLAQSLAPQPQPSVGVWGNSFGGLLAAQLAVRDARVRAVCINGAPFAPTVPDFRTAREQMEAAFGTRDHDELKRRVESLSLEHGRHRTEAAMLIVQGGQDPLVPLGAQQEFLSLSSSSVKASLTWADGEHTIYNHDAERNDRVSDWFAENLTSNGA